MNSEFSLPQAAGNPTVTCAAGLLCGKSDSHSELKEALARSILRFKKVILPFPPELDIHMGELFVLKNISEHSKGENIYVSDLQSNLFISKPAVSQMIGSLEKKGYLCRKPCLSDRRKIILTLTPKGLETVDTMSRHVSDVLDEIISRFGEANTSALIELFNSFADISDDVKDKITENHIKGDASVD